MASTSLHMMTKLSPYIYTYEPSETHAPATSGPKLVLFAAWMDAQDVQISKYLVRYQTMYPGATILLIKFVMREVMLSPVATSAVQPTVWHIRSMISAGALSAAPERPEILAHVFSNGGATTMQQVCTSYAQLFGLPFPLHCTVFDSCPGLHAFSKSYNALIASFPNSLTRFFLAPFIMLVIFLAWLWHVLLRFISGEDFLTKNARVLNDPKLVNQTNRTYIYGPADTMVDWRQIERHANEAAAKGFIVRKEIFDDSPHVTHMKMDAQRYWSIVGETWKEATST